MYPLHFEPLYKNYPWGGSLLCRYRPLPLGIYAESWEVSDRENDMSIVANGALRGKSLFDLVSMMGEKLLGKNRKFQRFPLLVKILDAKEPLSVQVHPHFGVEKKSEAWCFFQKRPSIILAGWNRVAKEKSLQRDLQGKRAEKILKKISVSQGDFLYVPGGVVHSIGRGSFLLEVQNNANTTYRLYDWERKDVEGKQRLLHIEEALSAIDWKKKPLQILKTSAKEFHFAGEEFSIQPFSFQGVCRHKVDPSSFLIYFFEKGEGKIATNDGEFFYSPMMSFLIAAENQQVFFTAKAPTRGIRIGLSLEKK